MRTMDRLAWPIIGAFALAAMVSSHALELWLENLRILGDGRANYPHSLQAFAIEAALALIVCTLAVIANRFIRSVARADDKDNLLPALNAIVQLGAARGALAMLSVQFSSLVIIELFEQRWSGFDGGLTAIIGPGHATAIIMHALVGLVFALALYRVSRFVCAETRAVACALATFLRRVTPERGSVTAATRLPLRFFVSGRKPPLLALGLANRPPPAPSTIAA